MKEKPYTITQAGGICFTSTRDKNPEIRVDNWIYDLWMPLLGATVMGVYTLYCRLDSGDRIWGMTLDDISKICRIGKKTLMDVNAVLEECKFITIKRPSGVNRLKHFTTEIQVMTPPKAISPEVIEKYRHPQGYMAVTKWLVKEEVLPIPSAENEPESPSSNQNFEDGKVSNETTGSSHENYEEVPHETPKDPCLSISLPLEDPSMHAAEPEGSEPQPTQTGMDGWMHGIDQEKFNFLWDCGLRSEKLINDLVGLPMQTLEKEWALVKNSTNANDKPALLGRNLRIALTRFQVEQRQAAQRAVDPVAHAHPDAHAYQRPEFITEAEWYGLSDIPAVYELLDGAWLTETGSIEGRTFRQTSALWMKYGDAMRERFAACVAAKQAWQEQQPEEDWA